MKYLHIIFTSIVLLLISSCAVDNLELSTGRVDDSDEITVLGHVTRFDDYDVETRSAKQGNEGKITSFAMAIFKVENGEATDCVHYEYHENQTQLLFTINRNDENNVPLYDAGQPYVIYVFANMPGMGEFSSASSLDDMLAKSYAVQDLNIPTDGFPMIGSLGDGSLGDNFSDKQDGQIFYMISGKAEHEGKPAVGDEAKTTLNIPLKALYAKINFEIEVRPDQIIDGYPPKFELHSYKIVNVPRSVDFKNSSNPDTDATIGVLDTITVETGNVTASGANKITFSFYLPENLVEPYKTWDEFEYPFGKGSSIREQDMKYRQRYKMLLLDGNNDKQPDRLATNIILSGIFQDHQDHSLKVDYTIYLGKDAFGDFNIERNGEYNNSITIRGILNSNDNHDNYISLDHRVNVEHTQPAIISLRREVLLDSHFEIRPLRIKKNAAINGPTHVKVQVVDPDITNWMRIERSYGNGKTITDSPIYLYNKQKPFVNGKRKYFTHNLISGNNASTTDYSLVNSTEVIVPLDGDNLCVWIYADECVEVGDGVREGIIKLTYGTLNGTTFKDTEDESFPPVEYTINQRKLFKVEKGTRSYHIEYEEEYLHNFDSEENYGETEDEGMEWGAKNIQFSNQYPAVYVKLKPGFDLGTLLDFIGIEMDGILNNLIATVRPVYDFYLSRDKDALSLEEDSNYSDNEINGIFVWNYSGYLFSQKIITKLFEVGQVSDGTLASEPQSAVEYCYNKNKRDINGQVTNVQWYLPAVDEIEEIVTSQYKGDDNVYYNTYARFTDFQAKKYWSSQPAYIYNNYNIKFYYEFFGKRFLAEAEGKMFIDNVGDVAYNDPGAARATSVSYINGTYSAITSGISGATYNLSYEFYNDKLTETGKVLVDPTPVPDEGYLSRSAMARVRCVRKQ